MSIESAYESQTEVVHDLIFSTQRERLECTICENEFPEDSSCWIETMEGSGEYVCCKECQQEWISIFFNYDFEIKQARGE